MPHGSSGPLLPSSHRRTAARGDHPLYAAGALLVPDVFVCAFALWTLGCHVLVLLGSPARALDGVAAVLACVLVVAGVLVVRRRDRFGSWLRDAATEPEEEPLVLSNGVRLGAAAVLALALASWFALRSFELTWLLVAATLLLLALRMRPTGQREVAGAIVPVPRNDLRLLMGSSLGCALVSLCVLRPRTDDTFYLNMALSVVEHPDDLLLATNYLHGPASDVLGPQRMFVPYRVHGFELLIGWITHATGIDVAVVEHLIVATLLAGLVPLALVRLLRVLLHGRWALALVAVLAFYLIEGSAPRGYANQALVRMFHGKSAMLTLMTPLICAYGLRFAAAPSARRWALLSLAQVAAVGLSSTAIWWAPVLAMTSVVAGLPIRRASLRTLLAGLLSTTYVLAVGLWVKANLLGNVLASGPPVASAAARTSDLAGDTAADLMAYALPIVLGPARTSIALLALVALAILTARVAAPARLIGLLALGVTLVFVNPWLMPAVASNITGTLAYQRVFWLLPVPIAMGLACVQGQQWFSRILGFRGATLASLAAASAFFVFSMDVSVVSEGNRASLQFPPTVKLWPRARRITAEVCAWAPSGSYVLAPESVMQQMGTRAGCGYPLFAGDRWLTTSPADQAKRTRLIEIVSDKVRIGDSELGPVAEGLQHYGVDVVVLSKRAMLEGRTKSVLRWAGFERVAEVEWDHVWVRTRPETHALETDLADTLCKRVRHDVVVAAPFGILREVGRAGCQRPLVDPSQVALGPAHVNALRLETILHTTKQLSLLEQAWVGGMLARAAVEVVVVREFVLENRSLKGALRSAGFAGRGTTQGHYVFVRKGPIGDDRR